LQSGLPFHVGLAITRNDKDNVFGTSTHFAPGSRPLVIQGSHAVVLELPELPLLSGEYWLSVYLLDDTGLQVYDMAEQICPFTVHNPGRDFGMVRLPYRWRL
jgi:lipopolysaccharide transport system ATP-binding protein